MEEDILYGNTGDYRESYRESVKTLIQSGTLSSFFLWMISVILAVLVYGRLAEPIVFLFVFLLVPFFILNIIAVFSSWYQKWGFLSTSLTNTAAGFVGVYSCVYVLEDPLLLIFALTLAILFVFIYQRLPLAYCLSGTLPYVIYFQYAVMTGGFFEPREIIINSFIIWSIEFYAFNASKTLERTSKAIYIKNLTITRQREKIAQEKEKADTLLMNILPMPVAKRLMEGDKIIADSYASATVLFADLEGFTQFSSTHTPDEVVRILNNIFTKFDDLADKYGVEKIKTIGDSYMAASGILGDTEKHAERMADMSLDMLKIFRENEKPLSELNIRIGINTGAVIAGVIGKNKFLYDLWSDAVNIASRMEAYGEAGRVQVSESTYLLLKDKFNFESRGSIKVKGKKSMSTFFLTGRKTDS